MNGERVLIVAADREGKPRRILRDIRIRLGHRYSERFLLADGTQTSVTVYAHNKSDAGVAASKELRELVGEDRARGAWAFGPERVS